MDAMTQAVDAVTSATVKMWMNWMVFIFAASLLFVWKHVAARLALAAFILSALASWLVFDITAEPYLIGIGHLIMWGPLAVYILLMVIPSSEFKLPRPFSLWIVMLLATIAVSLVFDIRDIALVLMNKK